MLTLAKQELHDDGNSQSLQEVLVEELKLSEEEQPWLGKMFSFHPLLTLEAHLPLGEVQQFRCHLYPRMQACRLQLFSNGAAKPRDFPFAAVLAHANTAELFTHCDLEAWSSIDAPAVFEKLDKYTRFLSKSIPPAVLKASATPVTEDYLVSGELELEGKQDMQCFELGSLTIQIMKEDDVFGRLEFKPWLLLRALRSGYLIPYEDVIVDYSEDIWLQVKNYTGMTLSLPTPLHAVTELSSDAAISRMIFNGTRTGSIFVRESEDDALPFTADLGYLKDLDVRPLFRRYGVRACFDADCMPQEIYDYQHDRTLKPGDEGWGHAKFVLKNSLAMTATGVEHLSLLQVHFLVANTILNAAVPHLPLAHSLRRLLTPFFFRTVYVNNRAAESLLPKNSMFHHSSALTYPAVKKLIVDGVARCTMWRPFPEHVKSLCGPKLQKLVDNDKFPFFTDGQDYYGVVHAFVAAWLDQFPVSVETDESAKGFWSALVAATAGQGCPLPAELAKEVLIATLAQFIFVVTGMHELVGSVTEYIDLVDGVGFRIRDGATRTDLQSWLITASILSTTGLRTPPLLSNFPQYFEEGGAEAAVWAGFQAQLQELVKSNNQKNEKRTHPFKWFNPANLEVAVSV